jgi:hypothetical protein
MPTSLASDLRVVTGLATAELAQIYALEDPELIAAALRELMPGLVDTYALAGAAVAADYYDSLREENEISGRFQAIVEPLGDLGADILANWAIEPLLLAVPNLLSSQSRGERGLQKRIANTSNKTVLDSSVADPKSYGYQRRTRITGCAFCKMVANRGAVYTKSTATFACHDDCYCEAVPAWGGKPLPVKRYEVSAKYYGLTEEERKVKRQRPNAAARAWINANLT